MGLLRDGDAAAVVRHGDGLVLVNRHGDAVGVTAHCLVYGVIDDLPQQVVKAALICGADIHCGTTIDRFEPLKRDDVIGSIIRHGCSLSWSPRTSYRRAISSAA